MFHNPQQSIFAIMPFLVRADLKEYPDNSFIYNPISQERLLKKVADDLAGTYIFTEGGNAVIADKKLMDAYNVSPDELAAMAEQNIVKLFQHHQVFRNDIAENRAIYSILLNNRNEASCMLSTDIWSIIGARHKDHIFVSVPKFNEIHYCTLKGNSLPDLISFTINAYNNSGSAALSPNIYLHHNGAWVMFDKGHQQILDYCTVHGIK